jgi:hypothetical protein
MKRNVLISTLALLAGSLLAADSSPKDDVKNAVKKLADTGNYAFTITTTNVGGGFGGGGGGGGGRGGGRGGMNAPMDGKVSKDGIAYVVRTMGDVTSEAVAKGAKRAVKTEEGWQTMEEMMGGGGGGFGGGRGMMGMMGLVVPATQAEELVGKVKELKLADGVYSGDLTDDGAKSLASPFPPRGGGDGGPQVSSAKGTVKFWVKDGMLTKYELHVTGSMNFNDNDIPIDRTTTVDVKDVGTTKVTIPDEAKKKVS